MNQSFGFEQKRSSSLPTINREGVKGGNVKKGSVKLDKSAEESYIREAFEIEDEDTH